MTAAFIAQRNGSDGHEYSRFEVHGRYNYLAKQHKLGDAQKRTIKIFDRDWVQQQPILSFDRRWKQSEGPMG